jgi:hypothetical protein
MLLLLFWKRRNITEQRGSNFWEVKHFGFLSGEEKTGYSIKHRTGANLFCEAELPLLLLLWKRSILFNSKHSGAKRKIKLEELS